MDVYPTTTRPARWDVVTSVDLVNATARVRIDDVWYPADWVTASTPIGLNFARTLQVELAGVEAGAGVPVLEDQEPAVEIKIDDVTLVAKSTERLVVKD